VVGQQVARGSVSSIIKRALWRASTHSPSTLLSRSQTAGKPCTHYDEFIAGTASAAGRIIALLTEYSRTI
jgi:hypothetical protein